jgi:hypothetical protein
MSNIARTAKLLKYGTHVGVALNATASALEISEACSIGREDKCIKTHYVAGGKLGGAVMGGLVGGALAGVATKSLCLAVAVPTGGWSGLACGIIVGVAGGYIGGALGESFGGDVGELLYNWSES